MTKSKPTCPKCLKRISKNRPKLFCTVCEQIKHFSCQGLSKNDAEHIINIQLSWTCADCIIEVLPINACKIPRGTQPTNFKIKCSSCCGYSYSSTNVRICHLCDESVHQKCYKNELGCLKCCENIIPGYHVNLYELYDDYNRLNNSTYNPYVREHFTNLIGDTISNEEHHNSMWREVSEFLTNCKYQQQKHVKISSPSQLNVFTHNIRSLAKNIEKLRDNIDVYNKYDILAFNETNLRFEKLSSGGLKFKSEKLPNGISDILLDNFHEPFLQNPASCKGGGLAIYVNKRVAEENKIEPYDPNPDPSNFSGEFQFIKIHECKGFNQTKIVGNVYRSPSRKAETFNSLLDSVLYKINRHCKKHIIIAGDFNMDLIKYESTEEFQDLINIMANHGFVQIISRPTRITDTSATLLDHVYTNNVEKTISSNVITLDLSDHLGTLTKISLDSNSSHVKNNIHNLKFPSNIENLHVNRNVRVINEANNNVFKQLVSNEGWESVLDSNLDAEAQFDKFLTVYTAHYNTAYPLKSQRIRRKNERVNSKPWMLPWLEDAIARKEDLYHKSVKFPTAENMEAYKKMNKFCEKHVNIAKEKHTKKYFEQHKDNSKKQWEMINKLLGRKIYRNEHLRVKDGNGNILSKNIDVAEKFNEYFSSIATNLKINNINNSNHVFDPGGFRKYLGNSKTQNSIYLKSVGPGEVHQIINKFQNKATLDTKIGPLKLANESFTFTDTLAQLVNNSFIQGIFPKALKTAKVVPIYKEGCKTDVENYRPISLLSSFSKIYEKLMHARVLEFLDKNETLFEMQYGFRPGRSCEHALLNAQNFILDTLSKKQIALLLLVDFSKAFDMIEHNILLKKLEYYGIRGIALKWFESYLSQREQFVSINGTNSSHKTIRYGVPQGSILGPLLFIVYINDIPGISQLAHFILYADDANIFITGKNMEEVFQKFDNLSKALLQWVNTNGLALNLKKTKYMIFSTQNAESPREIKIGSTNIERKREARFLGVIVDDKLNWSKHIATIKTKMARYVGIMYKLKKRLPLKVRIQFYHSFVQSHLNFCSILWGFAAKSNIELLFRSQKKAMRAIMPGYVNYFYKDGQLPAHTKNSFAEYEILTIHGIITKNALLFMHKIRNFPQLIPPSIRTAIPENAPKFYSDNDSNRAWYNKYGFSKYKSTVFCKGPLLAISSFNDEVTTLSSLLSIKIYNKNLKHSLLCEQTKGEQEEWPAFILHNTPGLRAGTRERKETKFYQAG